MVNKDYIMRMLERFTRFLTIIMGLRELNKHEEALIYIDDVMLQTIGLTSSFINSLTDETLLQILSPLGTLNVDKCLWIAGLLDAEGDIYADKGDADGSYYRYLKALNLFLEALRREPTIRETDFYARVEQLLAKLEAYELPARTKQRLFAYYEQTGRYAQAEDLLYELLEMDATDDIDQPELRTAGKAFYARLLKKSDEDLQEGNFSHEEAQEGLTSLDI